MGELEKLPNIGQDVAQQLEQVGVDSPQALRQLGAKEAWLRIQAIDDSACFHRLMALEGAVRGVKKAMLPEDVKDDLKAFYRQHRKKCCPCIGRWTVPLPGRQHDPWLPPASGGSAAGCHSAHLSGPHGRFGSIMR